jgi:oligopeptide/dipeptide ABC transporter ATP-binding protein
VVESGWMTTAQENGGCLLEVRGLVKHYPFIKRGAGFPRRLKLKAVDGVSFNIAKREVLALVGESGCGKTTTAKLIAGLEKPDAGDICFHGMNIAQASRRELRELRPKVQMVFQDPLSSLDPRMKIGAILEEPLVVNRIGTRAERMQKVSSILAEVGLPPDAAGRYAHEFSGGQRQRIGIGRALIMRPELIIADEPVSALDVSIQAQILNLLLELRDRYDLSILLIAHDLSVVRAVSERVAIMYLGRIAEIGSTDEVFSRPLHPYTQALLAAVPVPDPAVKFSPPALAGEVPSPVDLPPGCRFAARCPFAMQRCRIVEPGLAGSADQPEHEVACFLYDYVDESND